MQRIAIFASGSGSNARQIMAHFAASEQVQVALVVTNKANAGVLDIARSYGVPTRVITRAELYDSEVLLIELRAQSIDFIALAGFLWLMPAYLVRAYERRIVNIHPALLPRYGGRGMYGHHVHQAVHAAGERQSGISIHWVNEHYDEGDIIFQATCDLAPDDTPDDIARKVLAVEHAHFARVIERLLTTSA
jgi:phosphoribosylglycinamide formyltransferase 1